MAAGLDEISLCCSAAARANRAFIFAVSSDSLIAALRPSMRAYSHTSACRLSATIFTFDLGVTSGILVVVLDGMELAPPGLKFCLRGRTQVLRPSRF